MKKYILCFVLVLSATLFITSCASLQTAEKVPLPTGFVLWDANPRFAVWDHNTTTDPSDDVVLDRSTGLMWARDANLAGKKTWQDAVDFCDDLFLDNRADWRLPFGNRTDWRLPSIEELVTMTEPYPSTHFPVLPSDHPFVNVQSDNYWSGTSCAHTTRYAWRVDMNFGYVIYNDKIYNHYVWPVRGGN